MNSSTDPKKVLQHNTAYWMAAILAPVILHFGLKDTSFPWPVVLPLLLVGLMVASNRLLSAALKSGKD